MTTSSHTRLAHSAARPGTSAPLMMQAIVQHRYGRPDQVLRVEEVAAPTARANEVVIRVRAAAIHVGDLVGVTGEPAIARLALGLTRPRRSVPGTDVAGTVVDVGAGVTQLRPGDEVFGWCEAAFAQYACAPADHFVAKPSRLTWEEAAALGVSASSALQLLRHRFQAGDSVLINGGSGGLGSFAVQIAKAFGAEVTGVCSTGNVDVVRSLGAAHVIDYTKDDFTGGDERYDYILDNVGNRSWSRLRRRLSAKGVLQSNNGTAGGRWFGTLGAVIRTAARSRFTRRQAAPSIRFPTREDLIVLTQLVEAGKVTPLIDARFTLSDAARALAHVAEGHARGTLVLRVQDA
jgi:NADPH:quinone reductase-like Zn-dependent oxidoreductase